MIPLSVSLSYYKRPEIQKAILRSAADREVAVRFGDKGFGKRPDILQYPNDVLEFAKQGATSFHVSEERWSNVSRLSPTLRKQELDTLRAGWDLVLDIDCAQLEYSKVTADVLVKALQHHGVRSITIKFSGNHGFHIGVPFEAFPEKVHQYNTKDLFPEAPRRIAAYLKEIIRKPLADAILATYDINTVAQHFGKSFSDVVKDNHFDPFTILQIDTVLISSRHLYRMPYSLHEKSGLVSLPILPSQILTFDKASAKPEMVQPAQHHFLTMEHIVPNEAAKLIIAAFDYQPKTVDQDKEALGMQQEKVYQNMQQFEQAIPLDFAPPCIHNILKGLEDGKKRAMFVLVNYLKTTGWSSEKIDELLHEWNKRNPEPLRETLIQGHLRYHKQAIKAAPPPNCNNAVYFTRGVGICQPDMLCARIKNPTQYAKRKLFLHNRAQGGMSDKEKQQRAEEKQKQKEFKVMMKKQRAGAVTSQSSTSA
ncbi:hypothetical protein HY488_03335 [Candidatus Woesearchaeota archaeon]|nr:hypothetical protein [Candidatus Woesearchaeota archaeon]